MFRESKPGRYLKFRRDDWDHSEYNVPEHTQDMLENYVVHGLHPGNFGYGILTNDLCRAIQSADFANSKCLKAIVNALHYALPADCWGSPEVVEAWIHDVDGRRTEWVKQREAHVLVEVLTS